MKRWGVSGLFNYSYTAAGQVDQILRGTTALVDYDYLGPAVHRRRVYSTLDPNIHVDWVASRDGLLRLRESGNSRTDPGDPNYDVLWASYLYDRQPTGLPNRETFSLFSDPNGTPRQFEHDQLGRLERVIYGSDPNHSPQERFIMDLAGNRTKYYGRHGEEPNYTLDPNGANQYTLIVPGACEPNYDRAGNLVRDHRGYTYAYDHDNKLIRVSKGETTLVSYEYDALGRRVKSTGLPSVGAVRYYLSSGQNEVAEYDGAGQRLRYYVHGPTYIDERVVMHNDPVAGGAATTGSDYIYLLKDLYTVAGMADERGWPVERYDYDAYGKAYMERVRALPWAADFDGDGDVDDDDLAVLHAAYKGSGQEPNGVRGWRADLDGDGDVDGSDYALFADAYRGSGVAPGGGLSLRSASMVVSRIGNPYFFTGRRLDVIDIQNAGTPHHFTDDYAGLQLYDYRARTYDPVLGRFGQKDPLGTTMEALWERSHGGPVLGARVGFAKQYSGGMGLYEYARAAPGSRVDPLGTKDMSLRPEYIYVIKKCFCACGGVGLISGYGLDDRANDIADEVYPGQGPKNEAFRHCLASGILAKDSSCGCSECVGSKREDFQDAEEGGQDPRRSQRARNNNLLGRRCVGCRGANGDTTPLLRRGPLPGFTWDYSVQEIVDCCRSAVESGQADLDPGFPK